MTALFDGPFHSSPPGQYPEPTMTSQHGDVEEWRLDADWTRYRAVVVWLGGKVLIAAEPDDKSGRTWYMLDWEQGESMSDEYVAEKWRVRGGADLTNMARLLRAATSARPSR